MLEGRAVEQVERDDMATVLPGVARPADALDQGCHALAASIGACGHAVLVAARRAHGTILIARQRHGFPEIAGRAADLLARRIGRSSKPFWWSAEADRDVPGLRWADRLPNPLTDGGGFAFPVSAACGESGIVAFLGERLAVTDHNLSDIHAGCFRLFEAAVRPQGATAAGRMPVSRRELECLRLAADGCTSEEIAGRLSLSVHTANQYLTSVAQKLDASGRMHAVAKALRMGLIE